MGEAALASMVVSLVAPYLPGLLNKIGGAAATEAGKKAFGVAWDSISGMWTHLWGAAGADPQAQKAADRVAKAPDDAGAQGALKFVLEDFFEKNPGIKTEIEAKLKKAEEVGKAAGINVQAIGERSVAVGGSVTGNISTGDTLAPKG